MSTTRSAPSVTAEPGDVRERRRPRCRPRGARARAATVSSVPPLAEMPTASVPGPPGVPASSEAYSAAASMPAARMRVAATPAAYRDDPIPISTTCDRGGRSEPTGRRRRAASASARSAGGFASRSARNALGSTRTPPSSREHRRHREVGHVPPPRQEPRGVHELVRLLRDLERAQQPAVEQVGTAVRGELLPVGLGDGRDAPGDPALDVGVASLAAALRDPPEVVDRARRAPRGRGPATRAHGARRPAPSGSRRSPSPRGRAPTGGTAPRGGRRGSASRACPTEVVERVELGARAVRDRAEPVPLRSVGERERLVERGLGAGRATTRAWPGPTTWTGSGSTDVGVASAAWSAAATAPTSRAGASAAASSASPSSQASSSSRYHAQPSRAPGR